ncbi:MAG: hypothetical protein RIT10_1448 [Bacteroidota bacterium]
MSVEIPKNVAVHFLFLINPKAAKRYRMLLMKFDQTTNRT